METTETCDVLIVGARCAGAATATWLARDGLNVMVIDAGDYGADTLSTHALLRTGVLQLQRLGVLDRVAAEAPAIKGSTFHYDDLCIKVLLSPRDGVSALYAPRRTALDRILVDAARQGGARVYHKTRLRQLVKTADGRVVGAVIEDARGSTRNIQCRYVVGADGRNSAVATMADAKSITTGQYATAFAYGYFTSETHRPDTYQWYFNREAVAGLIPSSNGLDCVFVGTSPVYFDGHMRGNVADGFHQALAMAAPALAQSLAQRKPVERYRGFRGQQGYLRQSAGPGWALVGDAGYFKDPITAHGISDALRDSELLARAIQRGSDAALANYVSTRDALSLNLLQASDTAARLNWSRQEWQQIHRIVSDEIRVECGYLQELSSMQKSAA